MMLVVIVLSGWIEAICIHWPANTDAFVLINSRFSSFLESYFLNDFIDALVQINSQTRPFISSLPVLMVFFFWSPFSITHPSALFLNNFNIPIQANCEYFDLPVSYPSNSLEVLIKITFTFKFKFPSNYSACQLWIHRPSRIVSSLHRHLRRQCRQSWGLQVGLIIVLTMLMIPMMMTVLTMTIKLMTMTMLMMVMLRDECNRASEYNCRSFNFNAARKECFLSAGLGNFFELHNEYFCRYSWKYSRILFWMSG